MLSLNANLAPANSLQADIINANKANYAYIIKLYNLINQWKLFSIGRNVAESPLVVNEQVAEGFPDHLYGRKCLFCDLRARVRRSCLGLEQPGKLFQ